MKVIFIVMMMFLTVGFSWKKCKYQPSISGFGIIAPTTMSGQFTSSTGGCSALGSKEEVRKTYYALNFEKLKSDVAKGGGEYLTGFLDMSKCSANETGEVVSHLKSSYGNFFNSSPESTYPNVTSLVDESCGRI